MTFYLTENVFLRNQAYEKLLIGMHGRWQDERGNKDAYYQYA